MRAMLQEVPWPANARAGRRLRQDRRRARRAAAASCSTAIEPNEPVLALKITGPGQRATLSALVPTA